MARVQDCAGSSGPAQSVKPMPTDYRIFLLTVWRDERAAEESDAALRFSLHDPRNGQRRGFGEPESLLAFLEVCLDAGNEGNPRGMDESAEQGGADR
jgi:hypothetical protein